MQHMKSPLRKFLSPTATARASNPGGLVAPAVC